MTIYKYALDCTDTQTIDMPVGSRVLSVQMQNGKLRLWAMVNPELSTKSRRVFHVVATSVTFAEALKCNHLATVIDGGYVWHVFEQVAN